MVSIDRNLIKGTSVLFLLVNLCAMGYSQVTITLYNRSFGIIDSVVVELKEPFTVGPIAPGSSKTFSVTGHQANFHSVVPFSFSLYSPVLNQHMQWQKSRYVDTIYFFDHGLSKMDKEPKRPEEFTLYVSNRAFMKIDSVFAPNNAIKEIIRDSPRDLDVILDHKLADLEKTVHFRVGQRILTINLKDFNFNDWTDFGAALYVYDDSILTKRRENAKIFEFVIDFDIEDRSWDTKDDDLWKKVKIEAKHLLQSYVRYHGTTIRAVFDHARFISDPRFKVKIGRKTYRLNWKDEISAETEYRQVIISGNKGIVYVGY